MKTAFRAKFSPGHVVATPAILPKINQGYMMSCLMRHLQGQWGMLDAADRAANDRAVLNGDRILSAYPLPDEPGMFWIITEADRSVTTFLLPSDY